MVKKTAECSTISCEKLSHVSRSGLFLHNLKYFIATVNIIILTIVQITFPLCLRILKFTFLYFL